MSVIRLITSPIRLAALARLATRVLVRSVWVTAAAATSAAAETWRPISWIEEVSSSAALATVSTLLLACSVAAATEVACAVVSCAIPVSAEAVWCIWVAALATDWAMPLMLACIASASAFIAAVFSAAAWAAWASCAAVIASSLSAFSLNTCTAWAMPPTSSVCSR